MLYGFIVYDKANYVNIRYTEKRINTKLNLNHDGKVRNKDCYLVHLRNGTMVL